MASSGHPSRRVATRGDRAAASPPVTSHRRRGGTPMNEGPQGQVVTFYSFKGGTGRTMALANVAWILAASGKRVLVADWDLEAPGLHRFFAPFLPIGSISTQRGIIDMMRQFQDEVIYEADRPGDWVRQLARVDQYVLPIDHDFGAGALNFLSAGRQDDSYVPALSGLDWDTFYERLRGIELLDALREDMRRLYDYTLIDSR